MAFLGAGFEVVTGFDVTGFEVGGGLEVVAGFSVVTGLGVTVFGLAAAVAVLVVLTHSRNVISSSAKSFPQPPCILLLIVITTDVSAAGVLNIALCCVQ